MNADIEATDRWKVGLIGVLTDAAAVCSPIIAKKITLPPAMVDIFLNLALKTRIHI